MKTLYNTDFVAWLDEQISFLRKKKFEKLDLDHLLEEMEDLGGSYKRAIESHLVIIMLHLLKMKHQSDFSTKSWNDSIVNARVQIDKIIHDNPCLKKYPKEVFAECYSEARKYAAKQIRLSIKKFPLECPWTLNEVMGNE